VSDSVADEIAKLPTLTREQLRAKWRTALKQPAPPHLRKQLLVPLLAYKLQEQAYGGLKPHALARTPPGSADHLRKLRAGSCLETCARLPNLDVELPLPVSVPAGQALIPEAIRE
jgi:hypothetical protein